MIKIFALLVTALISARQSIGAINLWINDGLKFSDLLWAIILASGFAWLMCDLITLVYIYICSGKMETHALKWDDTYKGRKL